MRLDRSRPLRPAIDDIVLRQARRTPQATALLTPDGDFSYQELIDRASELAARLRQLRVGPGDVVAIAVPRSADMAVSVLGTFLVGAAYVPLNRHLPEVMRQDVRRELCPAVELRMDDARLAVRPGRQHPSRRQQPPIPRGTACVLYTSGSSGVPKGVLLTHASVIHRCDWMQVAQPYLRGEVCVQNTSLSVVDSLWELWGPLASGVPVLLFDERLLTDLVQYVAVLAAHRVSRLCMVPSLLRVLLDVFPDLGARLPDLRLLVVSGEPLAWALADRFAAACPDALLVNQYGLTESTADVTSFACAGGAAGQRESSPYVPIGTPCGNNRAYLLGPNLRPLPDGEVGELYIAGPQLSGGYLRRPRSTAEAFVPDPYSTAGKRLLRTGDLAYCDHSGQLVVVGRVNRQVKVRGFMVDLDAIEARIRAAHLLEAAVVVEGEPQGGQRIVAYVEVPDGAQPPDPQDIRASVSASLPAYCVPQLVTFVTRLPATHSGKVDRTALTAEEERWAPLAAAPWPDGDPLAVCKRALSWHQVDPDTNLLSIGVDSLTMMRLLATVARSRPVAVTMADWLAKPTPRALAALLESTEATVDLPRTCPLPADHAVPLSRSQRAIWAHEQLAEGNPYFFYIGRVFVERIDTSALEAALREVLRRHAGLLVSVSDDARGLTQHIQPAENFAVRNLDLSPLPSRQAWATARRDLRRWASRRRHTGRDLFVNVVVVDLPGRFTIVCVGVHHLVVDGQSLSMLIDELTAEYRRRTSRIPALPHRPVDTRFLQYCMSERISAETERRSSDCSDAWAAELDGIRACRRRATPAVSFAGTRRRVMLRKIIARRIAEEARHYAVTPFVMLLAAYAVYLAREDGSPDQLLGVTASARPPELADVVGCFVDVVPCRLHVDLDATFAQIVREVGAKLYESLRRWRHAVAAPMTPQAVLPRNIGACYRSVISVDTVHDDELTLSDLSSWPYPLMSGSCRFPLALELDLQSDSWSVDVESIDELVPPDQARAVSSEYLQVIDRIFLRPRRQLESLPMTVVLGARRIGADNGGGATDCVSVSCNRLVAQARATPHAVAMVDDTEVLTYEDILSSCQRIAGGLRDLDVGPGVGVALCLRRPLDAVLGLVAVLLSGGFAVPLDPRHPDRRLRRAVTEVPAAVLLTDAETAPRFTGASRVALLGTLLAGTRPTKPGAGAGHADLAYCLYTSGSQGRPKAVEVTQASLQQFLDGLAHTAPLHSNDRLLVTTGPAFDVWLREVLWPLVCGAAVVLPPQWTPFDPESLLHVCNRYAVTHVRLVPALLAEMLANGARLPASLREVHTGGERVPADVARRFVEQHGRTLKSFYGPTEATIDVAVWSGAVPVDCDAVPLGKPLPGAVLHVLTPDGQRVRPGSGELGEVYIGGRCLARGYRGRARLTAAAFVPDPFSELPGARMFRTGDLARVRADGQIEYLRRADGQVKVRGARVEPGEVEAVLRGCPGLADVIVVPRTRGQDVQLAAYVVAAGGSSDLPAEVRRYAASLLPEFMVPQHVTVVDALPLTLSGKVDHAALTGLSASSEQATEGPVLSATQDAVAHIWCEVLGEGCIEIDDDFFERGGDSLQAIRIVSRIRKRVNAAITLASFYENPTIAGVAALLDAIPGGDR